MRYLHLYSLLMSRSNPIFNYFAYISKERQHNFLYSRNIMGLESNASSKEVLRIRSESIV